MTQTVLNKSAEGNVTGEGKAGGLAKLGEFFTAARFLWPYRNLLAVSVGCALVVGAIGTGGLTVIFPILNVLLKGKTVTAFFDERMAPMVAAGEAVPWYLQMGRDWSTHLPANPVWAVAVLLGVILVMAVCANIAKFFQEHLSERAAIFAINDLRKHTYSHILRVPLGYFGTQGTSDVTSRLVGDCAVLQDGYKILLGQTVQAVFNSMLALLLAVWIDWRLTLFIVFFAPVMVAIIRKFGKKMRRATRAALQKSSNMLGQLESTLTGIRSVKAARAESHERRRYAGIMKMLVEQQLKMSRYEAANTPTVETLTLAVVSCVVLFAAWLILIDKSLSPDSFIVIMAALASMGESLRRLGKLNNVLQRSNAAAGRVLEVLRLPTEVVTTNPATRSERTNTRGGMKKVRPIGEIEREIRFEGVVFGYPGSERRALDGVDLTIGKGQTVAIVGRNGSGKTTLAALLPRFYSPDGGRVCIDGVDLEGVTLASLRKQIALVTQDSFIFPGTIHENIAFARRMATRGQVEAAAKAAFAHEFIMQKPAGYETMLDGLGGQLSGGQKQRICIARAILQDAPILILDEATSQVDAESEHLIQQAIGHLLKTGRARTTLIIAHRFSTILSADMIVVMEAGRIVGTGKHEQLLAGCETYRQLYERQLA
jgi:ABC-type multidrug transport system fused ATPase/permease subunit